MILEQQAFCLVPGLSLPPRGRSMDKSLAYLAEATVIMDQGRQSSSKLLTMLPAVRLAQNMFPRNVLLTKMTKSYLMLDCLVGPDQNVLRCVRFI